MQPYRYDLGAEPSVKFLGSFTSSYDATQVTNFACTNQLAIPRWLTDFKLLPSIYHQLVTSVAKPYGLSSTEIRRVFISSGLEPRIIGHIWRITSRSHPGWFTPTEFFAALALIAIAQIEHITNIDELNMDRLSTMCFAPLPHLPSKLPDQSNAVPGNADCSTEWEKQISRLQPVTLDQSLSDTLSHSKLISSIVNGSQLELSCNTQLPFQPVDPFELLDDTRTVDGFPQLQTYSSIDVDDEFGEFQTSSSFPHPQPCLDPVQIDKCSRNGPNYNVFLDIASVSHTEQLQQEWLKCLSQSVEVFRESLDVLSELRTDDDRSQFNRSEKGSEFILDLIEIYKVTQRIRISAEKYAALNRAMHAHFMLHDDFIQRLKVYILTDTLMATLNATQFDHELQTNTDYLTGFTGLDFNPIQCGVCLAPMYTAMPSTDLPTNSTNTRSTSSTSPDTAYIALAGRQYHATCANFWVNRIQPSLPALSAS